MVTGKPGVAVMTKVETTANGNKINHPMEQEVVSPPQPVVVPCSVGCSASQTVPIGSYASIKVGVWLGVTVEPEDIDEAFEQVSEWVAGKLGDMVEGVNQAYGAE